jgi:hypothetical protein
MTPQELEIIRAVPQLFMLGILLICLWGVIEDADSLKEDLPKKETKDDPQSW